MITGNVKSTFIEDNVFHPYLGPILRYGMTFSERSEVNLNEGKKALANLFRSGREYSGYFCEVLTYPEIINSLFWLRHELKQASYSIVSDSSDYLIQKNDVLITIHGRSFASEPSRIEKMASENVDLSKEEIEDLESGKMPDGKKIPIMSYVDVIKWEQKRKRFPRRYGIVITDLTSLLEEHKELYEEWGKAGDDANWNRADDIKREIFEKRQIAVAHAGSRSNFDIRANQFMDYFYCVRDETSIVNSLKPNSGALLMHRISPSMFGVSYVDVNSNRNYELISIPKSGLWKLPLRECLLRLCCPELLDSRIIR